MTLLADVNFPEGGKVIYSAASAVIAKPESRNRIGDRRKLCVEGRLTWRDAK